MWWLCFPNFLELTPGPETLAVGSEPHVTTSLLFYSCSPTPFHVAISSRGIKPSLTDPLCCRCYFWVLPSFRLLNANCLPLHVSVAFSKTQPDDKVVNMIQHAGFIVWLNLHHPACILIQESTFFFFSKNDVTQKYMVIKAKMLSSSWSDLAMQDNQPNQPPDTN